MFATSQHAHFIGIGGIGMSGIAEIMLNLGIKVSGSDLKRSAVTDRLAQLGATIYEGHNAANVAGATVVVTSSAVHTNNPEVLEAQAQKIPVIQRAEMLAELMRLKYGIAIAGMHGKTTTTSMVAAVLAAGGLDPTVVVGGRVDALGSNARLGTTQYLVAEADESDRSFLKLSPILAVVTNLDREHMDCYHDMADVERVFVDFMDRVPFYGAVTACIDNPLLKGILPRVRRRVFTYGVAAEADYRLELIDSGKSPSIESGQENFGQGSGFSHFPGAHRRGSAWSVRAARAGAAQHSERDGSRSHRAATRSGAWQNCRGARELSRSRSSLPQARRVARRRSGRRLRPPSHRNSRHTGRSARMLSRAHSRCLSTAPVLANRWIFWTSSPTHSTTLTQ